MNGEQMKTIPNHNASKFIGEKLCFQMQNMSLLFHGKFNVNERIDY